MKPHTSQKEARKFIGVINYYPDVWPKRSNKLTPLTRLTSIKQRFKRMQVEKDDFEKIECIVARDNLLTYPYFNEHLKFTLMIACSD